MLHNTLVVIIFHEHYPIWSLGHIITKEFFDFIVDLWSPILAMATELLLVAWLPSSALDAGSDQQRHSTFQPQHPTLTNIPLLRQHESNQQIRTTSNNLTFQPLEILRLPRNTALLPVHGQLSARVSQNFLIRTRHFESLTLAAAFDFLCERGFLHTDRPEEFLYWNPTFVVSSSIELIVTGHAIFAVDETLTSHSFNSFEHR